MVTFDGIFVQNIVRPWVIGFFRPDEKSEACGFEVDHSTAELVSLIALGRCVVKDVVITQDRQNNALQRRPQGSDVDCEPVLLRSITEFTVTWCLDFVHRLKF
jgi:hypothetical protein